MASRVCPLADNRVRPILDGFFRGRHIAHLDKHPGRRLEPLEKPDNLPLRPDMLMRREQPHRRRLVLLDDGQGRGRKVADGLVACEEAGADAELARRCSGGFSEELADLGEFGVELGDLR